MKIKKIITTSLVVSATLGYLYLVFTPSHPSKQCIEPKNIGLLVVATGRYAQFIAPLVQSAEKYFLPGHEKTFFIFTDNREKIPDKKNIVVIEQKRLGWPYDTMMRTAMYYAHRQLFESIDYLFACDADMAFVDTIGDEVLGELVGTQHPGFTRQRGTYESNPQSTAYVRPNEGTYYFAGGFYGGSRDIFIKLAGDITQQIKIDQEHGITAQWHDESHLNRYFIDHRPSVILSPSYCYPEGWALEYHPRLVALCKNHSNLRA
jgi:histo-blood group ABO system transferase